MNIKIEDVEKKLYFQDLNAGAVFMYNKQDIPTFYIKSYNYSEYFATRLDNGASESPNFKIEVILIDCVLNVKGLN